MAGIRQTDGETLARKWSEQNEDGRGRQMTIVEAREFSWDEYELDLLPLCEAKAEEFHLLGYEEVEAREVYHCAQSLLKGKGPLHQAVAAILGLQIGKFMNYMTMSAYKGKLGDAPV